MNGAGEAGPITAWPALLLAVLVQAGFLGLAWAGARGARSGRLRRAVWWVARVASGAAIAVSAIALLSTLSEVTTQGYPWTREGAPFGTYQEPTVLGVGWVAVAAVIFGVAGVLAFVRMRLAARVFLGGALWQLLGIVRMLVLDDTWPRELFWTALVLTVLPALVVAALLESASHGEGWRAYPRRWVRASRGALVTEATSAAGDAAGDAATVAAVVAEAIEANAAARAQLLEAVDGLTEAQRREAWCGTWGVHDIVAHLVRWQDTIASGLEVIARGKRPMLPEYEGDDDAFNAESARRFHDTSWEALLGALMQAREHHEAASKALIGQVKADRVEAGKTGRRFLFHPSNHEPGHVADILRWRRESGLG